ncbi:MAG TPA: VOC family protein [Candidatus Saccharimonadales bacterium]|nr:VOC family protein [Candidatus Saccharimonadales bacterium]
MAESNKILNGFGTTLFAGIPVKDIKISIAWYEKLLGCPPSFYPNEVEAVWMMSDTQWLYLIEAPERAGGSIQTIIGKDLEATLDQIAERGIKYEKEETPAEGVRKVMFYDPDGNEIGLGRVSET